MTNLLYSKPFTILLVVILILTIVALGREGYRYFRISQETKDLQKKISDLEKSNKELVEMKKYLESEESLEKEARLKLNLTKLGEKLIIIKTSEGRNDEQKQPPAAKKISNIQLWWEYFFGKNE